MPPTTYLGPTSTKMKKMFRRQLYNSIQRLRLLKKRILSHVPPPTKKGPTCTKMKQMLRRYPGIHYHPFLKMKKTQPWFGLPLRKEPLAQRWERCLKGSLAFKFTYYWRWENSAMIFPPTYKVPTCTRMKICWSNSPAYKITHSWKLEYSVMIFPLTYKVPTCTKMK